MQTILHVIHRPAPMARSLRSDIPVDLETIIDVCLQKSPERRYNSATGLADDLERFLHGAPIAARPASRLRRSWYWLLGIPIFGALLDNRVIEPTETHRWVQRGLISVAILVMLTWLAVLIPSMGWVSNRMPATVRVAGGIDGGSYDAVAHSIAEAVTPWTQRTAQAIVTAGSTDNAERLEQGEVEIALLQADAMSSPTLATTAFLATRADAHRCWCKRSYSASTRLTSCNAQAFSLRSAQPTGLDWRGIQPPAPFFKPIKAVVLPTAEAPCATVGTR